MPSSAQDVLLATRRPEGPKLQNMARACVKNENSFVFKVVHAKFQNNGSPHPGLLLRGGGSYYFYYYYYIIHINILFLRPDSHATLYS
jgi:hypothetical protein